MSNFSPSNLVKAQALLAKKYADPESRMKPSPVIQLGLKNQSILIPGHEQLRTREDRAVEAYLLARTKRATTASRTYNHAGNRGDSIVQALSWTSYVDKFSLSLKQFDNNMFSLDQVLAQQMENSMKNILESIETALVTYLQSERTEVNTATAGGTFNAANDAFEITSATQFYQVIKSMMRQNNYAGQIDLIVNSLGFIDAEYQKAQGAGNANNTSFQFNGLNIAESYELADSNYSSALALAMPEGSFAVLPWIPKQNRTGHGEYMSTLGGYGAVNDPWGLGLQFALHGYAERADTSASNGSAQDDLMQFELSVDIANPTSPLSVANETTIFEAAKV